MSTQQEPVDGEQKRMQWWKKAAILFLMIACIASAAYHHRDINPTAVAKQQDSVPQTQLEPSNQQETVQAQALQPAVQKEETTDKQTVSVEQGVLALEELSDKGKDAFSGVALFGNSQIDGFHIYNSLPGADCLYRVGLNVKTAFEKSMLGEHKPVIDKLLEKQYTHIFLTFGENELGWQYPEIFAEDYRKLIAAVRERQPDAKLYIQSILPVSAEVSQKNEDNTNNERIQQYNELLRKLAEEEKVSYLDVAAVLQDTEGNLPKDAATDGIHPGQSYNKKWAALIAQQVAEGVQE